MAYKWKLLRFYYMRLDVILFAVVFVLELCGQNFVQCVDHDFDALSYPDSAGRENSKSPAERNSGEEKYDFGAVYAVQGRRPYMEDRYVIEVNTRGTDVSVFGILDGHGGEFAADFAKKQLMKKLRKKIEEANNIVLGKDPPSAAQPISKQKNSENKKKPTEHPAIHYVDPNKKINFGKMLTDLVLLTDYELNKKAMQERNPAGSTLLFAIIHKKRLTVANVGDSRGVMCDSKGNTIPLSFDHKPQEARERKRIQEAGGFVQFYGVWRVNGILAVSRALGDYPLKENNCVIADPDILTFELNDHKPKFIILASDGLWDTFSNEEAVAYIKDRLNEPHFGAKSITLESYNRGSGDNITVMVIVFKDGQYEFGISSSFENKKSQKKQKKHSDEF